MMLMTTTAEKEVVFVSVCRFQCMQSARTATTLSHSLTFDGNATESTRQTTDPSTQRPLKRTRLRDRNQWDGTLYSVLNTRPRKPAI